jgi:hypothetical protein
MDDPRPPYSPVPSTSRIPYSLVVPSSDAGEREEWTAVARGERYWSKRREEGEQQKAQVEDVEMREVSESEDEVRFVPFLSPSSEAKFPLP